MRSPDSSIGREYISLHSNEREALVPKGTFLAAYQEAARAAPCPLWGFLNAYGYTSRI